MAELPTIAEEVIARMCGDESGYEVEVYEPTGGNSFSWGLEISQIRNGNEQALNALRENVLRDFGISSIFQTEDGGVFIVPHDREKACVEFAPAGAS